MQLSVRVHESAEQVAPVDLGQLIIATEGRFDSWIRTVRAECLDWLLIVGRGHLEQVLQAYVEHYNVHRPHRALGLEPPDPRVGPGAITRDQRRVDRRDRLGGLLHEYHRQAA
jgi:putative transposase